MALLADDTPAVIGLTERWVVAYKPAGWLTIPGRPGGSVAGAAPPTGVLSKWAEERYGRIWVVHRIDRDTSGLVLFAREAESHRQANEWFQKHQVRKTYDCLATGVPAAPVFRIARPIEGAPSVTQIEVRESYQEGFLARVRLHTGRRHQIRIHLAGEGYPLWGDTRYQGPTQVRLGGRQLGIERVALHAAKLELPTGEAFEAYWPEDFKGWVERLREGGVRATGGS
ncbi:MAG: RNA pseudouridine synthase [Oligoflexia bacterium]|nr:RNA pseudouridine synthase [Oligoflexia bacterium]